MKITMGRATIKANKTQSLKQSVRYISARLLPGDAPGFACLNLAGCFLVSLFVCFIPFSYFIAYPTAQPHFVDHT